MNRVAAAVRNLAVFWWDFIVGDDWRIAVGVIAALAATAAVSTTSVPAWWLTPLVVLAALAFSLWRATRKGA